MSWVASSSCSVNSVCSVPMVPVPRCESYCTASVTTWPVLRSAHALRDQDLPAAHRVARTCSMSGGRPTRSTSGSRPGCSTTSIRSSPTRPGPASRAGPRSPRWPRRPSRMRVGVLVTGNVYRHPAVLANMAATRRHRVGRPARARPRRRLERGGVRGLRHRPAAAEGALRPLRRGARGHRRAAVRTPRPTSPAGTTRCRTARCEPKPVQRPHPPICIGGTGEKRTLRSVARFAQHWNHPGGSPEDIAQKLDVLRGPLRGRGPRPVGDPRVDPPAGRAGRRPGAARRAGRRAYEAAGVAARHRLPPRPAHPRHPRTPRRSVVARRHLTSVLRCGGQFWRGRRSAAIASSSASQSGGSSIGRTTNFDAPTSIMSSMRRRTAGMPIGHHVGRVEIGSAGGDQRLDRVGHRGVGRRR